MSPRKAKPQKRIWELDTEALKEAYVDYLLGPVADRSDPFGKWFLDRYYIQGLEAWEVLENEADDKVAYTMLYGLTKEG